MNHLHFNNASSLVHITRLLGLNLANGDKLVVQVVEVSGPAREWYSLAGLLC